MKIFKAIGNHFAGHFSPLLKLLGALPECVRIISVGALAEFERVFKAATGPKK